MRVEHVMTLNPVACGIDDSCAHAARLMRDRAVGCVVVLQRERVVGLVTDRMLATGCLAQGLDGLATPVSKVMLRDVACVTPDESIFAVVDTLRSASLARRVPVVGPDRELLGIVSISDLAIIAKDLTDAIFAEELQHSTKRTRALTGAKRFIKRLRRPTKLHRLPRGAPVIAKRRPSRPGLVRNPYPRNLRRRARSPLNPT